MTPRATSAPAFPGRSAPPVTTAADSPRLEDARAVWTRSFWPASSTFDHPVREARKVNLRFPVAASTSCRPRSRLPSSSLHPGDAPDPPLRPAPSTASFNAAQIPATRRRAAAGAGDGEEAVARRPRASRPEPEKGWPRGAGRRADRGSRPRVRSRTGRPVHPRPGGVFLFRFDARRLRDSSSALLPFARLRELPVSACAPASSSSFADRLPWDRLRCESVHPAESHVGRNRRRVGVFSRPGRVEAPSRTRPMIAPA